MLITYYGYHLHMFGLHCYKYLQPHNGLDGASIHTYTQEDDFTVDLIWCGLLRLALNTHTVCTMYIIIIHILYYVHIIHIELGIQHVLI